MFLIPSWSLPMHRAPRVRSIGVGRHADPADLDPRSYHQLDFWCLHLYRWRGEVAVDGVTVPVLPGHAGICPPARRIDYRFASEVLHLFVHFQFDGPAHDAVRMPALIDLGERFESIYAQLHEAIGWDLSSPPRASARLWDVLWQLAEQRHAAPSHGHPTVAAARHLIEVRLAESLAITDLARAVSCSHNHLTRLFRAELGTTVVGYIRSRRMERARMLLEHGSMPIKRIAGEVGIADPYQFNKQIRQAFGKPPRAVRAAALRKNR